MHTIAAPTSYIAVIPSRYSRRPSQATFVRRRIVVAVTGMAVVVAASISLGGASPSSAAQPVTAAGGALAAAPLAAALPAAPTYVVRSGDTMWSIAERHAGSRSVAGYVDALIELNGGTTIDSGQQILLPAP